MTWLRQTLWVVCSLAGAVLACSGNPGNGNVNDPDGGADVEVDAAMDGSACGNTSGLQPGSPWPMVRGCPTHVARSQYPGTEQVEIKWTFITAGMIVSAPVIAADGTIYLGSRDSNLYAVNPDGSLKWAFVTDDWIVSSPAIGTDGTVYVGSLDGRIYAIDSDGVLVWAYERDGDPISTSPAIGADGTLHFGSAALTPSGGILWFDSQHWIGSGSAAIGPNGNVYIGTSGGGMDGQDYLVAYDPGGEIQWMFATDRGIYSSPVVGVDGSVLFSSMRVSGAQREATLFALHPDGTLAWQLPMTYEDFILAPRSSPAIAPDGTIYMRSPYVNLYALTPDGSPKWTFDLGSLGNLSPVIGSDGTIYVPAGNLFAINPDGTLKWELPVEGGVGTEVAIGADETIYFGGLNGKLYAIGPGGPGDIDHPPRQGHCGLTGEWVWCNYDEDCLTYLGYTNTCDVLGYCFHSHLDAYYCQLSPGEPCFYVDKYCNWQGRCTGQCTTHADCPYGLCRCFGGVSLCMYSQCAEQNCPPNTTPVESTLLCEPEPGFLQGDCHGLQGDCDDGYVPVGERGCVPQ